MLSGQAANSVMIRAKARYGKRLSSNNYHDMLGLSGVSEVTSYLKSRTHYHSVLEGLHDSVIHRGNIEHILKTLTQADIIGLCRQEKTLDEHFYEYIYLHKEAEDMLDALRSFTAGCLEEYLLGFKDYPETHSGVDLSRLHDIKTYNDFADVYKKSPFYSTLKNFVPDQGAVLDYPSLEAAVERLLLKNDLKMIKSRFHGKTARNLITLIGIRTDMKNICRIIRSKKYFDSSPELLMTQVCEYGYYISKSQLSSMVYARDVQDIIKILKRTKYRTALEKGGFDYIDMFADQIIISRCRKMMTFSNDPPVVLFCYIQLMYNEVNNITNIIEGIRYGVSPEKIEKMLI